MTLNTPDYFDTDGRPEPAGTSERKLKAWAILNALEQNLLSLDEACAAYGLSPAELEAHRAGWLDFGAGRR